MRRDPREPLDPEAMIKARLEDTPANRRNAAGTAKAINTNTRKKLEKKFPLLVATGVMPVPVKTAEEVWEKRQTFAKASLANLGEHQRREQAGIDKTKAEVRTLCTPDEFETLLDRLESWNSPEWAYWYAQRSRLQLRAKPFPFDLALSQLVLDTLGEWDTNNHPTHFELLDFIRAVHSVEIPDPQVALEILRELMDRGYVFIAKGRACTVSGRSLCPTWRFLAPATLMPALVQITRKDSTK